MLPSSQPAGNSAVIAPPNKGFISNCKNGMDLSKHSLLGPCLISLRPCQKADDKISFKFPCDVTLILPLLFNAIFATVFAANR